MIINVWRATSGIVAGRFSATLLKTGNCTAAGPVTASATPARRPSVGNCFGGLIL